MKLFEYPLTRSIRCRWLLNELDVPFESVVVDLSSGAHRSSEFLSINPYGKVPALSDGPLNLFESAAICTYLGDKYPDKGFIPSTGTIERALHDQWMFYCMSELEQPLWTIAKHSFIYPASVRSPAAIQLAKSDFAPMAGLLERHMGKRTYVTGESFQVVDVMIGHTLIWAHSYKLTRTLKLLDENQFPNLNRYIVTLKGRSKIPIDLRNMMLKS